VYVQLTTSVWRFFDL